MEIENLYACAFCYRRDMKAEHIAEIFEEIYGEQAYSIDSIRYWIRQINVGRTNLHDQPAREKPKDDGITVAVKSMIDNNPLFSARQIAKMLGISPSTVIDRLTNVLGYHCYQTKWVPHMLNDVQKQNKVILAKSMLEILHSEQRTHFCNIVTGDESWFLYQYTQSSQWVISKDELINRTIKTNMQRKMFVTIFFNGDGVVLVDFLPKGAKFNSDYFINIIEQIDEKMYPQGRSPRCARKVLHYDNSPCHKSKKVNDFLFKSNFRTMKHPAYSPDIAPSDFGLFGTVKEKLEGVEHATEKDLQDHIIEILNSFSKSYWQSLFMEWIERLEKVITINGNYI